MTLLARIVISHLNAHTSHLTQRLSLKHALRAETRSAAACARALIYGGILGRRRPVSPPALTLPYGESL
jgi:hypothetical protein